MPQGSSAVRPTNGLYLLVGLRPGLRPSRTLYCMFVPPFPLIKDQYVKLITHLRLVPKIRKQWRYIYTFLYFFMAWYFTKYGDNFTVSFLSHFISLFLCQHKKCHLNFEDFWSTKVEWYSLNF